MKNPPKRTTIYFDPDLRRGLRVKAVETGRSAAGSVHQPVTLSLAEDAGDIATFEERRRYIFTSSE